MIACCSQMQQVLDRHGLPAKNSQVSAASRQNPIIAKKNPHMNRQKENYPDKDSPNASKCTYQQSNRAWKNFWAGFLFGADSCLISSWQYRSRKRITWKQHEFRQISQKKLYMRHPTEHFPGPRSLSRASRSGLSHQISRFWWRMCSLFCSTSDDIDIYTGTLWDLGVLLKYY